MLNNKNKRKKVNGYRTPKKIEEPVILNYSTETKICSCCGQELPVHKFQHYRRKRDNVDVYNDVCMACVNAQQYERRKALMKEIRERGKYAKLDTDMMIEELKRRGYEVSRKQ